MTEHVLCCFYEFKAVIQEGAYYIKIHKKLNSRSLTSYRQRHEFN